MITNEDLTGFANFLIEKWGKDGEKVVAECAKCEPLNIMGNDFIDGYWAVALGRDLRLAFLDKLEELRPSVRKLIPEDAEISTLGTITTVLILCGVDVSDW